MQKPINVYIMIYIKFSLGRNFRNSDKLDPKFGFVSGLPPDQKSPFLKCYLIENNFI